MPYPALIVSGNSPEGGEGPWEISGNLYMGFRDASTNASIIYKSTDAGLTWAQVGVAGPDANFASEVATQIVAGTSIYSVSAPGSGTPNTMQICHFDTTTDTWSSLTSTAIDGLVGDGAFPTEGLSGVYRPSDQSLVIVGTPNSLLQQVSYFIYSTASQIVTTVWTPIGNGTGPGSVDTAVLPYGVVRGNTRTHIFLVEFVNNGGGSHTATLFQQTLEDSGSLEPYQTVDVITPGAKETIGEQLYGCAASDSTGSNVAVAWLPEGSSGGVYVYKGVSAASITFGAPQIIGAASTIVYFLLYGSDDKLYLTYNDTSNQSYYLDSGSGFGLQQVLGAFDSDFIQAVSIGLGFTVGIVLHGSEYFWAFTSGVSPGGPATGIINAQQATPVSLPDPRIHCKFHLQLGCDARNHIVLAQKHMLHAPGTIRRGA